MSLFDSRYRLVLSVSMLKVSLQQKKFPERNTVTVSRQVSITIMMAISFGYCSMLSGLR